MARWKRRHRTPLAQFWGNASYAFPGIGYVDSATVYLNIRPIVDYDTEVLHDSPVGYWTLEDSAAPLANVIDSETLTLNGSGTTLQTAGPWEKSKSITWPSSGPGTFTAAYDSSGAFVSKLNLANGGANTVEFWMKWDGTDGGDIVSFVDGSGQNYALAIFSGKFGFNTYNGDCWGVNAPSSGVWLHIVAVFYNNNATANKLYINGVSQTLSQQINSTPGPMDDVAQATLFRVGAGSGPAWSFDGALSRVAIYDYELSAARVLDHYNAAGIQTGDLRESSDSATVYINIEVGTDDFATPSLLDDFNRADGALGSNWGTFSTDTALQIFSNTLVGPASATGTSRYTAQTFEANCAVALEIPAGVSSPARFDLYARVQNDNTGSACNYEVSFNEDTGNVIWWRRYNDTVSSALKTVSFQAAGAGMASYKIGMRVFTLPDGDTARIEAWLDRNDGNGWQLVEAFEESTATRTLLRNGGQVAVGIYGGGFTSTTRYADNFRAESLFAPVKAVDTAQFVESAEVYVLITPSGTDVQETSGTQYIDSATVLVDIQVDSTEARESTDADTVLVDLQTSAVENAQFVDAATVLVDVQASGTELREVTDTGTVLVDIQTSAVEAADFVDSATVLVDLQTSATEARESTDTGTVYVDVQTSAVELAEFVDSNTVLVDIQTSASDVADYVDSNTALVTITPSATEARESTDADTVYVDVQTSGVDEQLREYLDSDTILVDLQASGVEAREVTDTATILVDLQTSATENAQLVDANTVLVDIQTSATDTADYVDSNTVLVDVQASGSDILEAVDANTVLVDLQASGSDIAEFVDAATALVNLDCSGTEAREVTDAATPYVDIQATSTDEAQYVDAAEAYVDIQPSGSDEHVGGTTDYLDSATVLVDLSASTSDVADYTESATPYVDIQASSSDTADFVDAATTLIDISVLTTDVLEALDAATAYVDLQVLSTEYAEFVDAATVFTDITVSGTDLRETTETGEVYIDLQAASVEFAEQFEAATVVVQITPSGVDSYLTEFVSIWHVVAVGLRWRATGAGQRWETPATSGVARWLTLAAIASRWTRSNLVSRWYARR